MIFRRNINKNETMLSVNIKFFTSATPMELEKAINSNSLHGLPLKLFSNVKIPKKGNSE